MAAPFSFAPCVCANCGAPGDPGPDGAKPKHCSLCKAARYCGRECQGKGTDLTPPCVTSLASPHRPKASDGSLEPRRREYLYVKKTMKNYVNERSKAIEG